MKRSQLIEIAILIVALILGYKFFESLISIVASTIYILYDGAGGIIVFQYIIFALIYLGAFFLLIKFRRQLAQYIHSQEKVAEDNLKNEIISISINQANLLYIVLIALCLITIISELSSVIIGLYTYFKREVNSSNDLTLFSKTSEGISFRIAIIRLIVVAVVLFYARPVSNWFGNSGKSNNAVAETTNES